MLKSRVVDGVSLPFAAGAAIPQGTGARSFRKSQKPLRYFLQLRGSLIRGGSACVV
jgi:hypothetical protein